MILLLKIEGNRSHLRAKPAYFGLLPTSGAYRLLVWHIEQDVSPDRVLFVQSK